MAQRERKQKLHNFYSQHDKDSNLTFKPTLVAKFKTQNERKPLTKYNDVKPNVERNT